MPTPPPAPKIPRPTPRLRLDAVVEDDAPFIFELVNDPAWLRYIGDRQVHSLDDARGYVRNGPAASYAQHGFGLWRVSLRDGTPIGLCGLLQRNALAHPDIGFAYLPDFRGRGYALEAARAVVDHARDTLGLRRLLAITRPDNEASMQLLGRLGMQRLGQTVLYPQSPGDCVFSLDLAAADA
jgi:[ribosomal protein S5]-alanine N-acetyltransferase